MKIAIDISQICYQGSGVARYVEQLVEHMIKNDDKNQYLLYGNSMRQKKILLDFIYKMKKLNSNIENKIIAMPQTLADILWNKLHILPIENLIGEVDIFHASDWVEPPVKKALKVTTIHDLLVFKYPGYFTQEIIDTQKRRISWVLAESNMVIVDSHTTKNDLIDLFDFPKDKIKVVYPGISSNFRRQSEEKIREVREKFSLKNPYILSVGTREPRKNVDKTIEAFDKIKDLFDFDLVIVGKLGWGPDKRSGDDRVKLLGYVDDKYLPSLYSAASCFVYPSLYEGFGFPILEAMACGSGVVTSKGGSLSEIGGKYAVYIDPLDSSSIASAILKVIKGLDKKTINDAASWARSFNWDHTAREIIKIYNSLH
ncbi:glycosyltransferase family 4 protein [Candidatus Gottesmanbacteria bacterium]|nr:glycosyltransferase family 4 protein [Candidatus Gottesmanbacteria bacterium]